MRTIDDSRARLHGVFNIAVTPFDESGAIDKSALAENIERVLDLGCDGILIGGTYGEFPAMSPEERADLFRAVMDVVGDRAPVMLCSAHSDVRIVTDLTRLAGDLGGIPMITAPYVSEVTDDQIVAFFEAVTPLSSTGAVIYNAPGIGITLSPALMERIADIPGIVGLKQGDLSPTAIDIIANRLAGRIRLFCASDLAFLGPIMAGFDGFSSTNSCVLPELILDTYATVRSNAPGEAIELHRLWYAYRALARAHGQPQVVKAAMAMRGFRGGTVRPPLRTLPETAKAELAAVMETLVIESRARTKHAA